MCDWLIFDMSNMLHRSYFANKEHDVEIGTGLAHHTALLTLQKYFKQYKPKKKVIMVFDRPSWRKSYTADAELCVSKKPYKGNRRQNMTPSEKDKYMKFLHHVAEFENLMRTHTSVICLGRDGLEADDLIAGFVQMHPEDSTIIVSADKDFIQLLQHETVQLIDPLTGKDRRKDEKNWNGDAQYFLFEKCLRGDIGDNVGSALPRVRATRIKKAYADPFERINLMNETWTNSDGTEFVVKHLFEENKVLMDLSAQPECVVTRIHETIDTAMENPGKYSHFHFLKFLGQYDLKKITENIDTFIPLLSR
jgi:hypothetical protein